jgi:hypothetical protein
MIAQQFKDPEDDIDDDKGNIYFDLRLAMHSHYTSKANHQQYRLLGCGAM